MGKVTREYLTKDYFKKIKALLDVGLDYRTIGKVTGKSSATVQKISEMESFEGYEKKYHSKYLARKATGGYSKVAKKSRYFRY